MRQNASQKKAAHQENWNEIWRFAQDVVKQRRYQESQRIVIDPVTPLLFAHESMVELWDLIQMLITSFNQNNGASTLLMHTIGESEKHRNIAGVLEELASGCVHLQHVSDCHGHEDIHIEIVKHRYHPIRQRFLRYRFDKDGHMVMPTDVLPYGIAT